VDEKGLGQVSVPPMSRPNPFASKSVNEIFVAGGGMGLQRETDQIKRLYKREYN